MKRLIALTTYLTLTSARLHNRAICTVQSHNDPLTDDSPALKSALETCGSTGSILIPTNQTLTLRSPVDLSSCQACGIRIDGRINISPDWDYWEKQPAVFVISGATALVIDSLDHTGVIDAQGFGWGGEVATQGRVPRLFSITDASYQIHIRDLEIRNAPGTVFYVGSEANAVRLYDVEIGGDTNAREGVVVEDANHVYVWNNTIHASGACVKVLPNSQNVQVEDSTCVTPTNNASDTHPSGIEINFGVKPGYSWIRNVLVRKFSAIGGMNVISFLAPPDAEPGARVDVTNATFTDLTISGPAKRPVLLDQGDMGLNATLVMFSKVKGTVETQDSEGITCKHESDVCDFRVLDCRRGKVIC